MSLTCSSSIGKSASIGESASIGPSAACGGRDYALGGIATMVVAIIGVAGTHPEVTVSISIRNAMPFLTGKSQVDWVADRIEEVLQHMPEDAVEPLAAH